MSLIAGTRLGPYEIVSPLGSGGMGEVYRARDARLGRDVAIKVLPQHLSSNPEIRARFEREARAVSSLNHPHICTLHDVGREGETDYLVMELVEGETLADRLIRGSLPLTEVLRLGSQIADALDRAHRSGVVHRDLKPGNVMLTKSGAKLMDFGLARATGLAGPGGGSGVTMAALSKSPTMAAPLTSEGTILGTFQYMSPEQLEGREADVRADLWALGCVLHEMATGKRAFEGGSQASLIAAIMHVTPAPVSQFAALSPPALDRLVSACLAKDPADRLQSAHDAKLQLEWIGEGGSQTGTPAPVVSRAKSRLWLAILMGGALFLAGALALLLGPWSSRGTAPPLMRFSMDAPLGTTLSNTAGAEISPDGLSFAFTGQDSSGTQRIYVRAFARNEARSLPGTEGGELPFWSPDSRMVGFFAAGKLMKVGLDGSPPVGLCDAPDGRGGAWSPRGEIVFAPGNQGPLYTVPSSGGAATPLTHLDKATHERGHRYPQVLPDGKHILYVAITDKEEVPTYAIPLSGGDRVEVCRAGSEARYAAPGWLLYLDTGVNSPHRRLLAHRFDPGSLKTTGDAMLVLDEVTATNFGFNNVTANRSGALVVQHANAPRFRLAWRGLDGKPLGTVIEDFDGFAQALSPDGSLLGYGSDDPQDLFVRNLATGINTRITFNNCGTDRCVWAPDGKTVAYSQLTQAHGWEVYTANVDGHAPSKKLFRNPGLISYPTSWSRDGKWLVAQCVDSTGQSDLWRVPMQGEGRAEPYQLTPEQESDGKISPDGHWLAYVSAVGGKRSVFVQSFPEPGAKYQLSVDEVFKLRWSDSGDAVIVITQKDEVLSIGITTDGGVRQGATKHLFTLAKTEFPVSFNLGQNRLLVRSVKDGTSVSRFEVILGWPHLLEQGK